MRNLLPVSPFDETEDQVNAIEAVLADLSSGRPMDRLLCGDVGFGKTEVALRAAFVAALAGKQVAVVVPTTLLARQHFKTFSDRFAGLPVVVRLPPLPSPFLRPPCTQSLTRQGFAFSIHVRTRIPPTSRPVWRWRRNRGFDRPRALFEGLAA